MRRFRLRGSHSGRRPGLHKKQIEDDRKQRAIIKQDLVLLKPHLAEITALVKQLRW